MVVIGDALDDAAAAAHVGARCILYDGGSHLRDRLEQACAAHLEATGTPPDLNAAFVPDVMC